MMRHALQAFANDHLGSWIGEFTRRLESAAEGALYGCVARVLRDSWKLLCDSHGLEDADAEGLAPRGEEGTPYECGLCEGAAGSGLD